ncbi:MAG: histone [Candidatus Micrarchaeia archaeon]|jgi:histone H3/H4
MKSVFPLWDLDTVIRNAGAERVSEEASIRLDRLLAEQASVLLIEAGKYARHAGRRQIKRADILLAAKYQKKR